MNATFKKLASFAGSLSLAACLNAHADEIVSVTVRDREFRVIKTLSATELAEFSELWSKKQKLPEPSPSNFQYTLDIHIQRAAPRDEMQWLYDSVGILRSLTKTPVPSYRIDSPERFNTLLGIDATQQTGSD